jgi:hypothetical protein
MVINPANRATYRWRRKHRKRFRQAQQKWRASNKEKVKRNNQKWHKDNRERSRLRHQLNHVERHYGIPREEFIRLFKAQRGRCAICRIPNGVRKRALGVDHCHSTNRVRGLLCGWCNAALGLFKEEPRVLRAALHYLRGKGTGLIVKRWTLSERLAIDERELVTLLSEGRFLSPAQISLEIGGHKLWALERVRRLAKKGFIIQTEYVSDSNLGKLTLAFAIVGFEGKKYDYSKLYKPEVQP